MNVEFAGLMPTIRDVAKRAGVSTATVSATLNGTAFVSPGLQLRRHTNLQ